MGADPAGAVTVGLGPGPGRRCRAGRDMPAPRRGPMPLGHVQENRRATALIQQVHLRWALSAGCRPIPKANPGEGPERLAGTRGT